MDYTTKYTIPTLKRDNLIERCRVYGGRFEIATPLVYEHVCERLVKESPSECYFDLRGGKVSGPGVTDELVKGLPAALEDYIREAPWRDLFERMEVMPVEEMERSVKELNEALKVFGVNVSMTDSEGESESAILVEEEWEIVGFRGAYTEKEFADLLPDDLQTIRSAERWLVSKIVDYPGSYMEPPMSDLADLRTFDTLLDAVIFAHGEAMDACLQQFLTARHEAQLENSEGAEILEDTNGSVKI